SRGTSVGSCLSTSLSVRARSSSSILRMSYPVSEELVRLFVILVGERDAIAAPDLGERGPVGGVDRLAGKLEFPGERAHELVLFGDGRVVIPVGVPLLE